MNLFAIFKALAKGSKLVGGTGSSHKGGHYPSAHGEKIPDILDAVKNHAQPWPVGGKLKNPTLEKVDYLFNKRILHTLIRNVRGEKVLIKPSTRHIFYNEGGFREDRSRYIHFLIPSILKPIEIWRKKEERGTTDYYIGGFKNESTGEYLTTFVVVPKETNRKLEWQFWVTTFMPKQKLDEIRKSGELRWAAWRGDSTAQAKVLSRRNIIKSVSVGKFQGTPSRLLHWEPQWGPTGLGQKAWRKSPSEYESPQMLAPLPTRWSYPALNSSNSITDNPIVKAPRLILHVKSDAYEPILKAIKTGGRAHAGMAQGKVSAIQRQAEKDAKEDRARLEKELTDLGKEWQAVSRQWQGYYKRYGKWAAEKHLDKLQAQYERKSRQIIRRHYEIQWSLGKKAGGNMLPLTPDEQMELMKMQRNEQQYFINLLMDIREMTWGMDPFRRIPMYANAAEEAFWAGMVLSDISPDVYWKWKQDGAKENCSDCSMMAKGGRWKGTRYAGTYSAKEIARIGIFPQSGSLKCCTNCGCRLVKAKRPRIEPLKKKLVTSMPVEGPKTNSFSGHGRSGRNALHRLSQEYKWRHRGRIRKSIDDDWAQLVMDEKSTFVALSEECCKIE